MIILTKEQFRKYLEEGHIIYFEYKKEEFEVYALNGIDEEGNTEFEGYFINTSRVSNIDKIIKRFKIEESIAVNSIDRYIDFEAFLRNEALKDIDMVSLIDKYKEADSFSLIAYCDQETRYDKKLLEKAYEKLVEYNKKNFEELYSHERIKKPFEVIYQDIKNECIEFKKKHNDEFICDHVDDDTKYGKPYNFFWTMYHDLENELDILAEQDNILKNEKEFNIEQLPQELKNNLISYELTYNSYSTIGPLQMVYYFKLNEETKNYLKQFENDFSLEKYEDLAFYKDGKQIFMSITHEQIHQDTSI